MGGLVLSLPTPEALPAHATTPDPLGPAPTSPPPDLAPGQLWLGDLDLSSAFVASTASPLRDVRATGRDVRVDAGGVHAARLRLWATLPFETAEAQIGGGIDLGDAGGGEVAVRRDLDLLGRTVAISGTGRVAAVDGRLVVSPGRVDVAGPPWVGDAVSDLARRAVTVEHSVEGLPEGTRLVSIEVVPTGFAVVLDGEDVRLSG